MQTRSSSGARSPRPNGVANGAEPSSVPLSAALEDVADAARRVVRDQAELLLIELRDMGRQWAGGLLLARVALPLAGLGWLALLAALAIVLARRFDWPAAFVALAVLNLGASAALCAAARHFFRGARRIE
jgi:uncharacterized membrane protein YqjE